ncbi:alpha/beta hydrolase family protein [Micromonospora lupini]|uniref:alpha/beta hydrolase n=1 Tax=Micromonospora lupini TaxID=285679 RepID=UPI00225BE238|nr:alpha/beta hydrolase [Micromonospora lupini]MCX5067600.1 alpha/beta hydrolase family protein [Micromonospora lupini]
MSGVGYRQLWAADPGGWRTAGAAWAGLTGPVERHAGELAGSAGRLRGAWSGAAAVAVDARLAGLRGEVSSVTPALIEADQVLSELAGQLVVAKARLAEAVARADAAGLVVDRSGAVHVDPAHPQAAGAGAAGTGAAGAGAAGTGAAGTGAAGTGAAGTGAAGTGAAGTGVAAAGRAAAAGAGVAAAEAAAGVAAALHGALELADAADRLATDRLDELARAAGTGWASPPPPGRPVSGATPALVRAWWSGLTPAQRRWLVGHESALVGGLDGVPVAARDQANRLRLGARRAELLAERRRLLAQVPPGPLASLRLRGVAARLAGLDALAERLTAGEPRAYLLGLDPAGEGRVVVALGDPDHADRVLTYVPGMTAGLDDASGELGRAARVLERCATLAPGERSAAVLWLDYDAPDFLTEAASAGQARDAGPALHRFQEGLRATHEGPPARQTVLGHSYGSLVVGVAAREHGLAADALMFVGSPGVGAAHAADLGVPAGEVWAGRAPDDVIRLAKPVDELGHGVLRGAAPLAAVLAWPDRTGHELWFGHDPADSGFGGRVFPSGRGGHSGYWEPGNPALDGMARVVLGR